MTKANHVVVRFLSQQPEFRPEDTILESVLRGNKKSGGQTAGGAQEDWEMESQAKTMLTRLGVTDFSQKCGELSGRTEKTSGACGRAADAGGYPDSGRADEPS